MSCNLSEAIAEKSKAEGIAEGLAEGLAKGVAQGRENTKAYTALKMLKTGKYAIDEIADLLELPVSKVIAMQEGM